MRQLLITLLLCVSGTISAQTTPLAPQAQLDALQGKVLTLRQPASGDTLEFSATGKMLKGKAGVHGVDDLLIVRSTEVRDGKLTLEATRAILALNSSEQRASHPVTIAARNRPVKVVIHLTGDNSQPSVQPESALSMAFVRFEELEARACPSEEASKWVEFAVKWKVSNEKGRHARDASTGAKLEETSSLMCMATGQKGWNVSKEITPPKAIHTPDPNYDVQLRREGMNGGSEFVIRVNEGGEISDIALLSGDHIGFVEQALEALRKWRFKPAVRKQDGAALPVFISVDFNFRLY